MIRLTVIDENENQSKLCIHAADVFGIIEAPRGSKHNSIVLTARDGALYTHKVVETVEQVEALVEPKRIDDWYREPEEQPTKLADQLTKP